MRGVNPIFIKHNVNPINARVGDCTVRAISAVLDQNWERTYIEMCLYGFMHCDMPSANNVWGAYLRSKGWERCVIPNDCPDCYCVKNFCEDYPTGRYVMAISGHVVAVIDGDYYDTWDSGDEVPVYFWKIKDGIR